MFFAYGVTSAALAAGPCPALSPQCDPTAMSDHALISARFSHMQCAQWEYGIREIALSVTVKKSVPKTTTQAMNSENADEWAKAIYEEFQSMDTPIGEEKIKCMDLIDKSDLPAQGLLISTCMSG